MGFSGKNGGVGCHALLQGIFPTQGSNPGLPHCRQILYCLSRQGSPFPWLCCAYFPIIFALITNIMRNAKGGHLHIPRVNRLLVQRFLIWFLWMWKRKEKKNHIFICNNIWLKFSTHSIPQVVTKSWSLHSTCDFYNSRNHRYFHKALGLYKNLKLSQTHQYSQRND